MTLFDETQAHGSGRGGQGRPMQPIAGGSSSREARMHLVERAAAALATGGRGGGAPPPPSHSGPAAQPAAAPPPAPSPGSAATPTVPPPHPAVPLEVLLASGLIPELAGSGWSLASEEIAMVQHQVMRVVDEGGPRPAPTRQVILVASALPGEGKSFMALNLAASIALTGARPVLLVDADGASGSLSALLRIADEPGVRDLMVEPHRRPADLIRPTALERLSVLPHGAIRERQPEAAPGSSMAEAVLRMAQSLPRHVIVLDTPPCLTASVSSALAGSAGQVLLVVDAQRTEQNEVEAALDVLEACPVLQLVLNRVRLTSNDSFGAHGHRGSEYAS
jgi:protein-tyrosine kinase